jgi:hypothetical protein
MEYNFGINDPQNAHQDFPTGGYVDKDDTIITSVKGKICFYNY